MLPDSQVAFWLALHHCLHVPRVTAMAVTSADPQRLECKVLLDMQRMQWDETVSFGTTLCEKKLHVWV